MEDKNRTTQVFRYDLQILRGFAVLAVLLYHANKDFFKSGYLGVDVFFVISGFVVTPLILRIYEQVDSESKIARKKLLIFFKKRFKRLVPALGITVLVTNLLSTLFLSPDDHKRIAQQGIASLFGVSNLTAHTLVGDYFNPTPNPLLHTWSLSVEGQIYLIIPLFIYLIYKFVTVRKIFIFYLVVTVTSFLVYLEILANESFLLRMLDFDVPQYYSAFARIWQFSLGGIIFFVSDKYNLAIKNNFLHFFLLFMLFLLVFIPISINSFLLPVLVTVLTCSMILYKTIEIRIKYLRHILIWCGDRSYSIYLVHLPLLLIAKHSSVLSFNRNDRYIETIIAIILTFYLGNLLFVSVEKKFNTDSVFILKRKIKNSNLFVFILAPLLTSILLIYSVSNNFWGQNRNILAPVNAIDFDSTCEYGFELNSVCVYNLESEFRETAYSFGLKIKNNNSRLILLIGDSYAGQLKEALFTVASKNNLIFISRVLPNCPFILPNSNAYKLTSKCSEFNEKTMDLVKNFRPKSIVLSQYISRTSNVPHLYSSIKNIRAEVDNLFLVRNIPIFPDLNYMISRPILFDPYEPPKFFEVDKMNVTDETNVNRMVRLAQNIGIQVIDFRPLFCDLEYCNRFYNDEWLYSDVEHLSIFGARLTIPTLTNLFVSLK